MFPEEAVSNYNRINENGDLIVHHNDTISRSVDPNCNTSSTYIIQELLSADACGSVYKAVREGSDRFFAIKIIKVLQNCSYYSINERQALETVCS